MVITFLTRALTPGGAERQLVVLARGLQERGHQVTVVTFYGGGLLEGDLREVGVTLRNLGKKGRWDILAFLTRLVRLVWEEKPDVLHAYLGISNVLTVLLKPIFPRTRMVWGVRQSNMELEHYDWLERLSYRVECRLSRFADLIIVNSYAGSHYAVANGFPKNKMVVIPNGIDTERFRPDPEARQRIRTEWGVTESEKLIGLVGRLDPMKDHPTFLRAAAMLSQERGDVRFVCMGDGPEGYRRELRALGKELGLAQSLLWAGVREDVTTVYNALDIATSSSYGEGFPNVVGEAMACGAPCVVTDVGDSARLVGETGVVVPPKDPEALAAGWKTSLARDGSEMALKARLRVEENFSVGLLVEQTEGALWSKDGPAIFSCKE